MNTIPHILASFQASSPLIIPRPSARAARLSLGILMLVILVACGDESEQRDHGAEPGPALKKITEVAQVNDESHFIDPDGQIFIPWGFNYTNPEKIDLLEDTWEQDETWEIIAQDFADMKGYSANIVRIHLQYHRFMTDETTPDAAALEKLEQLVEIAEENRLYLLVTGLGAYRKEDQPAWYDALSDRARAKTHQVFWEAVAQTIGESPAVFAYDLMNEPVAGVGCDDDTPRNACPWLPGEALGDYYFVQNIALKPDETTSVDAWISSLKSTIRSVDPKTLLTVGFLPLGHPARHSVDLDFVSIHLYPDPEKFDDQLELIRSSRGDKPVVLEEFLNLHCSIDELRSFYQQAQVQGALGHYFGETIEDMREGESLKDELMTAFLEYFIQDNPNH